MKLYGTVIAVFLSLLACSMTAASAALDETAKTSANFLKNKRECFRPAGKLNYTYDRGVFVPLRSGQILCLDGFRFSDNAAEPLIEAVDHKQYGVGRGMVELYDPVAETSKVLTRLPFRLLTSNGSPCQRHTTAIELSDGRILIVGRFEENLPGASVRPDLFALIYDWHKNVCDPIPCADGISPRGLVTLNLLADDRVLILGGDVRGLLKSSCKTNADARVLALDPSTRDISVVGSLRHARHGHATVQTSGATFLVFGGWGPSEEEAKEKYCATYNLDGSCHDWHDRERTREVELFDSNSGRSSLVGHLLTDRCNFSATGLPDGNVFISGGPLQLHTNLSYWACEVYDVHAGHSTYVGVPRTPANIDLDKSPFWLPGEGIDSVVALLGNDIILVNDLWVHIYDYRQIADPKPIENHRTGQLLVPRQGHQLIKTAKGTLLVMGGHSAHGDARVIEKFIGSSTQKK